MNKKQYSKPELKTCKMELGVFGQYGPITPVSPPNVPKPSEIIGGLGLRLE